MHQWVLDGSGSKISGGNKPSREVLQGDRNCGVSHCIKKGCECCTQSLDFILYVREEPQKVLMERVRHDWRCGSEMELCRQRRGIEEAGQREQKRPRGGKRWVKSGRMLRASTCCLCWDPACLPACFMQGTDLLWPVGWFGKRGVSKLHLAGFLGKGR